MGMRVSRVYQRRPRLYLFCGIVTVILLFTLLRPDEPTSQSVRLPGWLPSHYPAYRHLSNPLLEQRLHRASEKLHACCRKGKHVPVYPDPSLTASQEERYARLKADNGRRYMIVTTIREIQEQLPDFINTLIVLITYLGPDKLAFSILEGPSGDCTPEILEKTLWPTLLDLGVETSMLNLVTRESQIDFSQQNRIEVLAELRNRALEPLWDTEENDVEAVIMVNDVFMRAEDILELVYQHVVNGAGITTAWDWLDRHPEHYYDVWVGRTIDRGDLFYPITFPWWSPSEDLFNNSPRSREHFDNLQPFQVYSSWNGIAVLDPEPFLPPHNVRFRRSNVTKGECAASECSLIAQDFWSLGYGKIQVVPSVQLAYTRKTALETRDELEKSKYALGWVDGVPPESKDQAVVWRDSPPGKVRCHPWPEKNGLSANVWEETRWVDPLSGLG